MRVPKGLKILILSENTYFSSSPFPENPISIQGLPTNILSGIS